jgi:NAD(P)-dependent dehydrogenase (short-subunit alcohol dehydrogenase family)
MIAASSKGLGRAVALESAKEGARIAMCSRNRDQVRLAAESIHMETGAEVYYEQCDVTRPEEVRSFVGNTLSRFGNIHILVTAWEESIPLGRLGHPYECAALVAFLASERASYITGTTFRVDGGAVKSVL